MLGLADGGALEAIGGSVMRGLGVGTAATAVGVGVADGRGSAVTGFVNDSRPAARNATPRAVRSAGTIRERIRSRRAIGPAS
jgi:hypothetical protein